jgi:hypothetical protein
MAPTQLDPPPTHIPPDAPSSAAPIRTRYAVIFLAILAGSGVGAAIGEIHRNATSPAPPVQPRFLTYQTDQARTFYASRRIASAPFMLQRLRVTGHGGTAVIEWYAGAWSPLVYNGTEGAALYLDGVEIAETVAGGRGGEYDARDAVLRWIGPMSAGPHVVSVRLVQSNGAVALPVTVAGRPVQEGVSVTEYVRR